MTKIGKLLIIIFFSQNLYGQYNQTLSEQLWAQVQNCNSEIVLFDYNEDGQVNYDEIIDDSPNGYLKIVGGWPACGCGCENTVGAYRIVSGEYVFIKESVWNCNGLIIISSSKGLSQTFPFDLEADGFFSESIANSEQSASFYINIEIPRHGTETKITLNLIPFGMNTNSRKNIDFGYLDINYRELDYDSAYAKTTVQSVWDISTLVSEMKNDETLNLLLDKQFDKISSFDMEIVNGLIDRNRGWGFESKEDLVNSLQELKRRYNLFSKIDNIYIQFQENFPIFSNSVYLKHWSFTN